MLSASVEDEAEGKEQGPGGLRRGEATGESDIHWKAWWVIAEEQIKLDCFPPLQ